MTNNLYRTLVINDKNYDNKKVVKNLIILKHLKPECSQRKQLLLGELYFLLARTIIKSINGFFSYAKKKGIPEEKILHTNEDVALEFFIVLDTCVRNVKLKHKDSFAFFYNKALLRASVRLFEKNYKKHTVVISNEGREFRTDLKPFHQQICFNEIDLKNNFTEEEMTVIETKLNGEKLNDFLKRSKMANLRYYEVLATIKVKLQNLYSDDFRRIQANSRTNKVQLQHHTTV